MSQTLFFFMKMFLRMEIGGSEKAQKTLTSYLNSPLPQNSPIVEGSVSLVHPYADVPPHMSGISSLTKPPAVA